MGGIYMFERGGVGDHGGCTIFVTVVDATVANTQHTNRE